MSYFGVGDVVRMDTTALRFHRKHGLLNPGEFPCIVIKRVQSSAAPGKCTIHLLCSKNSSIESYSEDDFEIISKCVAIK